MMTGHPIEIIGACNTPSHTQAGRASCASFADDDDNTMRALLGSRVSVYAFPQPPRRTALCLPARRFYCFSSHTLSCRAGACRSDGDRTSRTLFHYRARWFRTCPIYARETIAPRQQTRRLSRTLHRLISASRLAVGHGNGAGPRRLSAVQQPRIVCPVHAHQFHAPCSLSIRDEPIHGMVRLGKDPSGRRLSAPGTQHRVRPLFHARFTAVCPMPRFCT